MWQRRSGQEIYLAGWAREIVAIDLSAKVLEVAQRRAQADGVGCIQYFQSDMNHLPVGRPPFMPGSFDARLGVASVHHCANLEQLYHHIGALLSQGAGCFWMNTSDPTSFMGQTVKYATLGQPDCWVVT